MNSVARVSVSQKNLNLLRISIGVIYLWFGALKFFQGYSPAEDLAINTIEKLTFGLLTPKFMIVALASWECLLGILLISGKYLKPVLILLLVHMICTFTPLIFFPAVSFKFAPYGFTLVGQYIMKNIIIISAAIVLWTSEKLP
jgi:uncharacterized membrane protein YphA (DoxX/SURF4 family)